MADINKLIPHILKWEGGFVNNIHDKGGATMKGVTLRTYTDYCERKGLPEPNIIDLQNIPDEHWNAILKEGYWNRWRADEIKDQSVANILVDWVYNSGVHGIRIPQYLLSLKSDGIVGKLTLNAINSYPNQQELFERLKAERIRYYNRLATEPSQKKFLKGWINRVNDFRYETY